MKIFKKVVIALFAGLIFTGMAACEKEGQMEKAGKAMDKAASDASDSIKDAGESIEKKLEQ
jgi:hypothetical protein